MSDFVTIATYTDYITANLDKSKLDAEGILCYLADEHTTTINWMWLNAMGGIRLRVLEGDVQRTLEILGQKPEATPVDHTIDDVDNLICPNCGSNNTATEKYSKSAVGWSWLLLGFPVSVKIKNEHRCFYCGHHWHTITRSS